jgi:D-inositol-3-phosphate glycosyltransferase
MTAIGRPAKFVSVALLGTTGLAWSIMARRSKERRATVVLERPSVLHETLGGDPVRHVAGHLDEPTGLEPSNPNDLRVEGWAFSQENPVCHVEVWLDGRLLGRAAIGRPRPDVAVALGRPAAVLSGFELLVAVPLAYRPHDRAASLQVAISLLDGTTDWWLPRALSLQRPLSVATETGAPFAVAGARNRPGAAHRRRGSVAPSGGIRTLWLARGLDKGGSQLRMAEVIAHLGHVGGFTSTVFAAHDGPLRPALEAAGATVHPIPLVPFDDLRGYEKAVTDLSTKMEGKFDLVVGPTVTSFPAVDSAVRLGIPSVLRIGEAEPLRSVVRWVQGPLLHPGVEQRARRAVGGTSIVWSNSDAAVRTYRGDGYAGRFVVLGSGVDVAAARAYRAAASREAARERLGVGPDDRLIVCAATMWKAKGQGVLVSALDRIHRACPRLRCVLIGHSERPYTDAINQFVTDRGLEDAVRILPFSDDLRPSWLAADAAVLLSESESLPAALVEAMAFGLPVLATRVGDIPTLIEPGVTGWLCEPSDVGSAVAGLSALAASPMGALRAMGRAGEQRVARAHDRNQCLERTVEMFHAAVVGRLPRWAQSGDPAPLASRLPG